MRMRPCAFRIDMALAAARRLDAVIHAVLVAVDALHAALEMDVAHDGVRRHPVLGDGVACEAARVLRLAHREHAPLLLVELREVVRHLLRHLEEMVIGILGGGPRAVHPLVHAVNGTEPGSRNGGTGEVFAQHLPRPLAGVVGVALLVAGEAVGLQRPGNKPALTRTGHLLHRALVAADAAAREGTAEHLRPLEGRKADLARSKSAGLSMQRERHGKAERLVGPEPGLHLHGRRRVVGVEAGAEVRASARGLHVVALSAGLVLRYRRRERCAGGNLVAVEVERREPMHGDGAPAVPVGMPERSSDIIARSRRLDIIAGSNSLNGIAGSSCLDGIAGSLGLNISTETS